MDTDGHPIYYLDIYIQVSHRKDRRSGVGHTRARQSCSYSGTRLRVLSLVGLSPPSLIAFARRFSSIMVAYSHTMRLLIPRLRLKEKPHMASVLQLTYYSMIFSRLPRYLRYYFGYYYYYSNCIDSRPSAGDRRL